MERKKCCWIIYINSFLHVTQSVESAVTRRRRRHHRPRCCGSGFLLWLIASDVLIFIRFSQLHPPARTTAEHNIHYANKHTLKDTASPHERHSFGVRNGVHWSMMVVGPGGWGGGDQRSGKSYLIDWFSSTFPIQFEYRTCHRQSANRVWLLVSTFFYNVSTRPDSNTCAVDKWASGCVHLGFRCSMTLTGNIFTWWSIGMDIFDIDVAGSCFAVKFRWSICHFFLLW